MMGRKQGAKGIDDTMLLQAVTQVNPRSSKNWETVAQLYKALTQEDNDLVVGNTLKKRFEKLKGPSKKPTG